MKASAFHATRDMCNLMEFATVNYNCLFKLAMMLIVRYAQELTVANAQIVRNSMSQWRGYANVSYLILIIIYSLL
jgi:hypothetical protein